MFIEEQQKKILTFMIAGLVLVVLIVAVFYFVQSTRTGEPTVPLGLADCDFKTYVGRGCAEGSICFQGLDTPCTPSIDCSAAKNIGDNKCHKICRNDSDCLAGYKCLQKEAYLMDVASVNDMICVME